MEPASTIIKELGGATKVAEVTGVHRTGVWKWTQPKEAGGSAGMIPTKHIPKLLDFARERGIALSAESFFPSSIEQADEAPTSASTSEKEVA